MRNYNTPSRNNQPLNSKKSQEIDWSAITGEVAHLLMNGRPYTETDAEIRFGNRGSFRVFKDGGFHDYEESVTGGTLDMICHLCGFERKAQAMNWLQEKGFLNDTFTPSERSAIPHNRRQRNRRSNTGDWDGFEAGLKLWQESEPVSHYQSHPVRRWSRNKSAFPDFKELPPTIRWHPEYKRGVIIVALAPIQGFIDACPEPPEPRQFHLIAIDAQGLKRGAFPGGDDKRLWGTPGVTCVALFGDPTAEEIYVAEGVADALAIFGQHRDTPVIASTGGLSKLVNCSKSLGWLSDGDKRAVTLFPDNDDPGRKGRDALMEAIGRRRGDVCYVENWKDADPADAALRGSTQ